MFKLLRLGEHNKNVSWYGDYLTTFAIKFKLGCLFSRRTCWGCNQIPTNEHLTVNWPTTEVWREKWNKIFKKGANWSAYEGLTKEYLLKQNQTRFAPIVNRAIDELTEIKYKLK